MIKDNKDQVVITLTSKQAQLLYDILHVSLVCDPRLLPCEYNFSNDLICNLESTNAIQYPEEV